MAEVFYRPLDGVQVSGARFGDPPQHAGTSVVGSGLQWSDESDATYATLVTTGGEDGSGNLLLVVDHGYVTWPDVTSVDQATLFDLQIRYRVKVENLGSSAHETILILTMVSNPDEEGYWQLSAVPAVTVDEADYGSTLWATFSWRDALLALYAESDLPMLWPLILPSFTEQVRSLSLTAEFVGDSTDIFQATIYDACLVVITTQAENIESAFDLSRCAFT